MYNITDYTKQRAKLLGVTVKPSKMKNKKIDIFLKSNKIASIGDIRYKDYPTYINERGKYYADKRRESYYKRHAHEAVYDKEGNITNSFFAKFLLW